MGEITLQNVSKVYGNEHLAVKDLNIDIADGEFLVMVGPSGCGKTTALRMVAGLEDITDGTIEINGRVVNKVKPKDRDIAMVFQDYALYPQMTVYENMAFGLKTRKVRKTEIDRIVREVGNTLGLGELLHRKPGQLSGGQRQRVAMGRALTRQPTAFLMDEPLSNLDAKLRVQMRAEIARIQAEFGITTLYVTHDQVEAVTLGDRVAVLRDGVLQQIAPPKTLYESPRNVFVASFIGSPAMNLMRGSVSTNGDDVYLSLGSWRLRLDPAKVAQMPALRTEAARDVSVGLRPEDVVDVALDTAWPADQRLRVVPALVEDLGAESLVYFDVPTAEGAPLIEHVRSQWVARFGRTSQVVEGDAIEVGVDTKRLHFFDAETGITLDAAAA